MQPVWNLPLSHCNVNILKSFIFGSIDRFPRHKVTIEQFYSSSSHDNKDECRIMTQNLTFHVLAELGDYDEETHTAAFISEFRFVQNQNEEFEFDVLEAYKKIR